MQRNHWMCFIIILGSLWLAVVSHAQQEKTKTFYLTLSTKIDLPMQIPGMPEMGNIPGMPNLPGMGGGKAGKPYREITGRAVYPNQAVDPIFVTVPADLKLPQNKLVLEVPKPTTDTPDEGGEEEPTTEPRGRMVVTTKLYWHPETAEGPITDTFDSAQMPTPGGMMGDISMPDLERLAQGALEPEAYGAKSELPEKVVGSGDYVLNTGGTAAMTGFLPPLKVTAPASFAEIIPADGFTLEWEPVAGARGYIIHIDGNKMDMSDEKNMNMSTTAWVSTRDEPPLRVRYGYRQETTISDDLEAGILLPGDTTSCIVPPGIFSDENMLNIRITAVGNDFYSTEGGITVFGTIRSEWSTMLMMMDMGDFEE